MKLKNAILAGLLASFLSPFAPAYAASEGAAVAKLTAEQIVERNVAARGGLAAWRATRSIKMTGLMDAGRIRPQVKNFYNNSRMDAKTAKAEVRQAVLARDKDGGKEGKDGGQVVQLPFVLEMKRPNKSRLELQFQNQTAVQTFDGVNGWKVRPFLGRMDADPYTAEEVKAAEQQQALDGPLIDYAAKGSRIALTGVEQVDGRIAYKLKLTLKTGQERNIWVDAQNFLDIKTDGSRKLDGKPHAVDTRLRDYRSVHGLMIPHLIETRVEGVKDSERIIIDQVALNPELADTLFGKPN